MKKLIIILCVLLSYQLTFKTENSSCQWVKVPNGMGNNKSVNTLAISGDNIFAAAYSYGVYLTTNNGVYWMQTSLNNHHTISLAVYSSYVFAGVENNCQNSSGVYRSTNNGINWIQTAFSERHISSLALIGSNVFAGCWGCVYPGGVYLSTDNGINWNQTSLINIDVHCLTVSGNNIFAGIAYSPFSPGGVYRSTDNGTSWTLIGLSNKNALTIAVKGNNIFAGTHGAGVYLTTNSGVNWTQTSLNNQRVKSIVISEDNIFAGTEIYGVYLSTDNGANWIQKNQGLDTLNIKSLLVSNDYIFAGTHGKSVWCRNLSEIIGIKQLSKLVPTSYSLYQNYPNPFNPSTNIEFDIPKVSYVKLSIYDILGRVMAILVKEKLNAGSYILNWDASDISSGIYFYKIEAGSFTDVKRMLLVK